MRRPPRVPDHGYQRVTIMALLGHTFVGDGLYCEHSNEGAPQGDPATTGVIAFRSQCGYPRGRHVALPPPIEPVRPETIGYLTESEIRAIDLAAEVWNLMAAEVVEAGSARRHGRARASRARHTTNDHEQCRRTSISEPLPATRQRHSGRKGTQC